MRFGTSQNAQPFRQVGFGPQRQFRVGLVPLPHLPEQQGFGLLPSGRLEDSANGSGSRRVLLLLRQRGLPLFSGIRTATVRPPFGLPEA